MALAGWPAVTDDSGTKMDGTPFDEALWDAAEAAIEAAIVGTEDPSQTPGETTDEVIQARGSMPTLDARLDVSLNENGTLKTQSGVPLLSEVKSLIANRDILANGDLADWSNGGALAPDGWTLLGGAAIARTGPGQADTISLGTGEDGYAAKITRAGVDSSLEQDVVPAASWTNHLRAVSRKVSVAVVGISDELSQLRLGITDGVSTTYSDYHSGSGFPEFLSVVHTISGLATKLSVFVVVEGSNTPVYVGGFRGVFGDLEMLYWQPMSLESRSLRTVAFRKQPILRPGSAAAPVVRVGGRLAVNTTQVGNVGGGTDPLMSFTIPANALDEDGKAVRITASGAFAANANNKQLQVAWGGGTIESENLAYNAKSWTWRITLIRVNNTTAAFEYTLNIGTTATSVATENYVLVGGVAGFDFTTDEVIQFNGTATANDDITQRLLLVELVG